MSRAPHWVACLGLGLLALLAYSNSFQAGFVLDNRPVILENPRMREPFGKAFRQIVQTEYWWPYAGQGLYRPLTTLSYWMNYRLLGNTDRPTGYHVVNFLLHAGNAMLVYALVWMLTRRREAACAAGAVFALHPIATEAVTNIVGRADLLATFGVLGGLLAFVRSKSASGWRRAVWLAIVTVAYAAGLFSKENAVVLPALALLYNLVEQRRVRNWAGYAAMVPALAVWYVVRRNVLGHSVPFVLTGENFIDNSLLKGDAWTARLTAVKIIGKYFGLLIWPATLSADYSYNQIPLAHWTSTGAIAAGVAIVGVIALAVWQWRRQPAVSFFLLMFFVALAPASNLVIFCGSTMAERFLYLPLAAFAGLTGWCAPQLLERVKVGVVVVMLILVAYGVRTYFRNEDWHDDLVFWVKLVSTSPNSVRAHAGLATVTIGQDPNHQYTDAAVASLQRAAGIAPGALPVQMAAGLVYRVKGDAMTTRNSRGEMLQTPASLHWYQQSLAELEAAAVQLNSESPTHATGQPNAAINVKEFAVYDELGQTRLRLANPSAAVEAFRRARRANPTREKVYLHLADALMADQKPAEATLCYWQASFISADRTAAQKALAALYSADCPQLNSSCPRIREDICRAYREMAQLLADAGQTDSAREAREHAAAEYRCLP